MFDPLGMCRIFNEEGVNYVVLGGFAAVVHGSPITTRDLDILPDRDLENLNRLGRALTRIGAKIRISGEPVETQIDGPFLANMPFMLNLVSELGELDLTFAPAGPLDGFSQWNEHASTISIAVGLDIRVAALDDVIDSKAAADRPKDRLALPFLESLRDEIRRSEEE